MSRRQIKLCDLALAIPYAMEHVAAGSHDYSEVIFSLTCEVGCVTSGSFGTGMFRCSYPWVYARTKKPLGPSRTEVKGVIELLISFTYLQTSINPSLSRSPSFNSSTNLLQVLQRVQARSNGFPHPVSWGTTDSHNIDHVDKTPSKLIQTWIRVAHHALVITSVLLMQAPEPNKGFYTRKVVLGQLKRRHPLHALRICPY